MLPHQKVSSNLMVCAGVGVCVSVWAITSHSAIETKSKIHYAFYASRRGQDEVTPKLKLKLKLDT